MIKVFLDTDVIISSQLSERGAAHHLLYYPSVQRFITQYSVQEMKSVLSRLALNFSYHKKKLDKRVTKIDLPVSLVDINEKYSHLTNDSNDSHIVAGAHYSQVQFLITYNLKDYKIEFIKRELNIQIFTPARFLQYLRSLE